MTVHLPKGTRDLLPEQMHGRQAVIGILRSVFVRYGFAPLETPAFERIETLAGKYGDEGEKLIYRILKRGEGGTRGEVDLALRYDLTVPLARVIAMNPGLRMPFKRYQIQPVWRADRPQKGRFREFYQCDVDTVGSTSPVADAECLAVLHDCLVALGFQEFRIRLNHRALLSALAKHVGAEALESAVLVALDKLDKIGWDRVGEEMCERGVAEASVRQLRELLTDASLASLGQALGEAGEAPIALLAEVMDKAVALGVDAESLVFDPVLARGLGYYTGPIFEAEVTEPRVGSIAGGGRYDGLIGMFSKKDVPAVGISLGLERILVVLEEWGKLPGATGTSQALVTVFSADLQSHSLAVVRALRQAGVAAEMTLDEGDKLGRQFKRAHALGIPWVLVMGPDEVEQGMVQLKHLESGDQESLTLAQAIAKIQA